MNIPNAWAEYFVNPSPTHLHPNSFLELQCFIYEGSGVGVAKLHGAKTDNQRVS